MRKLREEFSVSLHEVDRRWIRIPATILLSVFAFPLAIISGIYDGIIGFWREFFMPCIVKNYSGYNKSVYTQCETDIISDIIRAAPYINKERITDYIEWLDNWCSSYESLDELIQAFGDVFADLNGGEIVSVFGIWVAYSGKCIFHRI